MLNFWDRAKENNNRTKLRTLGQIYSYATLIKHLKPLHNFCTFNYTLKMDHFNENAVNTFSIKL